MKRFVVIVCLSLALAITGILVRSERMGMFTNCYYSTPHGEYILTVRHYKQCPRTIEI